MPANATDNYLGRKLFSSVVEGLVPNFSDRVELAFEVEAQMRQQGGWSFRLSMSPSGTWCAEFHKDGVQGDWSGWTAAETICEAARAALEADEDE